MRYQRLLTLLVLASAPTLAADHPRKLVVILADHELLLVQDGHAIKSYPVAVGKPSTPSPTGTFNIVARVEQPTWWGPHGEVVAPGPDNPLGTRWMGLSCKGYGIHGTNAPASIGTSASHGCIRMRKQDVEELFELVRVGDRVEIVNQPGELELSGNGDPQAPIAPSPEMHYDFRKISTSFTPLLVRQF